MRISGVNYVQQSCTNLSKNTKTKSNTSFKALLSSQELNRIRLCVFDLDDTLIRLDAEGKVIKGKQQELRDNVLRFSTDTIRDGIKRVLVYASSRPIKKIQPLIDDKTLVAPDFCVGDNGVSMFKKAGDHLEEIKDWAGEIAPGFKKDEIRGFMADIAKRNMFGNEEWSKVPPEIIPAGQKEFRGSKITEYEVFGSPLNIYFMMAPGMYEKSLPDISRLIKEKGIKAEVKFQRFDSENLKSLNKWFPENVANDMRNHAAPRVNPDGSVDVVIITATSDKGKATEHIRKDLGIKTDEVLAAGDDVNDLSNADKGYKFILPQDAKSDFIKALEGFGNIIRPSKPGIEGIWEAIG